MPLKKWIKLNSSLVIKNAHWAYYLDKFRIDDGHEGEYHYVHTNGASMVIPVDESGRLILVNQYRYLNQRESLEFPCGAVADGLSYEENAMKELREETGLSAGSFEYAGEFSPYTGASDEMCKVFIARALFPSPLPKDPTEDFEIYHLSVSDVEKRVQENSIWDGLTICAFCLARKFLI